MTYLHARPPRVDCPTHGVRQVRLPWAEVRARFTALFERLAIDVLKETDIRGATGSCGSAGRGVAHPGAGRRVRAARQAPARDAAPWRREKAIAKGHQYLTLVCDVDRATVEYLAEDRKQASLEGYFTGLAAEQLAGIRGDRLGHVGAL